jgi:hypothetical protein
VSERLLSERERRDFLLVRGWKRLGGGSWRHPLFRGSWTTAAAVRHEREVEAFRRALDEAGV